MNAHMIQLPPMPSRRMTSVKKFALSRDPSKYPDLIVRVTGFTAYFNALSPAFRELVVKRLVKETI